MTNKSPLLIDKPMMRIRYLIWRVIMAKGQIRGNKETKKPKKSKEVVVPNSSVIPMKPSSSSKK
jgi:hypothetical protein